VGKVKGMTVLGSVKFLRLRRDDALHVLPAGLHHYLDERIRPTGWYPEVDLAQLVRATASLIPGPRDQVLEAMGETTAREHAEVYGDLMAGGSSTSRAFALWSTQHDTGELRMTPEAADRVRFDLTGYEDPSRELCLIVQGYLKGTMYMNGYRDVAVEKLACRLWNDDRCAWRVSWKEQPGS
jgi:hypothetical protein